MLVSIPRYCTPTLSSIKPRVGLLNPAFVYRNAASTNIRETFDRVRAEQAGK